MTKEEILNIQIQEQTISEWIRYCNCYSMFGLLRVNIDDESGMISIKAMLTNQEIYSEIFFGHYTEFERFINSMRFFRKMFTQR